ncbi:MAG TPA: HRDC domain-containing protein [Mycobacteriales bacterium]|nr:HRDC domain-containing protein [Mycobacteriales bacterium]
MSEALDDAAIAAEAIARVDEARVDEAPVDEAPVDQAPEVELLAEPRDGIPDVINTLTALEAATESLRQGTGAVAVDAERASGYRYGQRAYLVQIRREGTGTILIDPIPFGDLRRVGLAVADAEWVVHAASQDLPCLRELGLEPTTLFDTELAARLAGFERVGLATMVELLLGLRLAKEHSAVDWSRRPLPEPWLGYAALDVEVLLDLRAALEDELRNQNKLDWARQEFAAVLAAGAPAPRADPWRRTSGIHRIRNRRQLAIVRALWEERDRIARARDTAPGRILSDASIVAGATAAPESADDLAKLAGWGGRSTRRLVPDLFPVIEAARALPEAELPRPAAPGDGPPPANRWPDRDPVAAGRLARARAAIAQVSAEHRVPAENLLTPDLLRRLAWSPPSSDPGDVRAYLVAGGARPWQVALLADVLAAAMVDPD